MSRMITNVVIFFLISNVPQTCSSGYRPTSDYCKLDCRRTVHTVCHRKNYCGPEPGCEYIPMTVKYREEILHYMNEFRDSVANGTTGWNYGNRGAKDMNALSYDLELEYIASCWVNTCQWKSDECRKTKRFDVGQIMNRKSEVEMEYFVHTWSLSAQSVTANLINSYYIGGGIGCPHCFTALAWSSAKYVGCGLARSHKTKMVIIICNYSPRGNIPNNPVYKMARENSEIATECASGTNKKYKSLCGKIDPIPDQAMSFDNPSRSSSVSLSDGKSLLVIAVIFSLISFL